MYLTYLAIYLFKFLLAYSWFTILCFCCTTKWVSRIYTNIPSVLDLWPSTPFPPLWVTTEHWAELLEPCRSFQMAIYLHVVVHICRSQSPSTRPHSPLPCVYMSVLCVWPWHLPGLPLSGLSTVATWHLTTPLKESPILSETFWKTSALSLI